MDLNGPNRFPHRKAPATERFLGVPSRSPLTTTTTTTTTDELHEDDVVFFSNDYYSTDPNKHHFYSSSSFPSHQHCLHSHKGSPFAPHDSFGILAALPENETSPNHRNVSQLFHNHKASVSSTTTSSLSSSSSSSSRLIPAIPRPTPQDRISSSSSSSSVKYQTAPVNVPFLSEAMMKAQRRHREFDEDDGGEDEEEEEEMLPPHEIVARNSAQSPTLSCSVLEGAGRTLKGRDLRRVRNAVWRQLGFLD